MRTLSLSESLPNIEEEQVTGTSGLSAAPYLSPRARRRQLWLTIHRWLGIVLLIPMALLGFSGSLQVWPEETEALMNRERAVAATADPALLTAAHVSAARTGLAEYGPITRIELGEVGSAIVATSAPYGPPTIASRGPVARQVWVDPDSAQVLDSGDTASFMGLMHMLHGVLLIPGVGRQVVGIMGLFLTISGITGLVVFWPGMRRFVAGLRWQRRDGKALNLHRQSGVILSLVLIVEAITGAWISFPGFFASLVEPGVEQPQRPPRGGSEGTPLEAEDASWMIAAQSAQAAYDGRLTSIAAPMAETQAWTVTMSRPGKTATVTVPLGGGTPEVKEEEAREGPPPATSRAGAVGTWMRQAHYALIGGFAWQVLVFLSGWALTFLAISGVYVWGKRQLLGKKRRR